MRSGIEFGGVGIVGGRKEADCSSTTNQQHLHHSSFTLQDNFGDFGFGNSGFEQSCSSPIWKSVKLVIGIPDLGFLWNRKLDCGCNNAEVPGKVNL